jgi:hypothetical protein
VTAEMTTPSAETRLALIEQSVQQVVALVEDLAANVRRTMEVTAEIMVIRADHQRTTHDISTINLRIDRVKADLAAVDAKHDATARTQTFWLGAAWGAGGVIGVTLGVLVWIAQEKVGELALLRDDVKRIEIQQGKGAR